ncbi:acetyl-CoA acetyltransferase [Frankia sp. EI5c]|uniref:thiolase C-terminal domain-containing protein n=1 Tax=Frankia sp. EI5c TaxID=683316 RepID=UPI0007C2648D|nr:thiolase [Frankia sp. EI5c]OAA27448.1 acetyl-CoA acetyltransferase [Frankia sp. EI5c]
MEKDDEVAAGGGTALVGIGATEYFRRGGAAPRTALDLAAEAVRRALDDAGLRVADLDGFAGYAGGLDIAMLAHLLGVPEVRFTAALGGGGGGSAGSVGLASMAVETGQAAVVVSVMAVQQSAYRLGRAASATAGPYAAKTDAATDFTAPYRLIGPGQKFAMVARRHMHLFGTKREHFAEVALSTRANALSRPSALMRRPLTVDDYFAGRMISDPMCLYDFCLESDGAVAVITTSLERARNLRHRPVRIVASASGGQGRYGHSVSWMNAPDDYFASSFHRSVAQRLFARAQLSPADISVAQIYDHFTPLVLMQLEDYGFCPRGEAGRFVAEGNIRWPGGSTPVNTHGGNLSEAYIMGMTHIKEAVEQLRGTAVNQVEGARTALVTGGPAAVPVSGLILAG